MTRKTLPREARPHTSPEEAEQIETAAHRRRAQMLPGEGPHAPDKDVPVDHYKGDDEPVLLPEPETEAASYTEPVPVERPEASPDTRKRKETGA